jgi:hypothetical protein
VAVEEARDCVVVGKVVQDAQWRATVSS